MNKWYKKRRITRPEKAGITIPQIVPYKYSIDTFHKIKEGLELSFIMERTVLYSDVDVNQHLNNSRYIEWAFDVLPFEFFENNYFKKISIIFKKEMMPGTTAKIYRYIDDNYIKVVFKAKDDIETYFELGAEISCC